MSETKHTPGPWHTSRKPGSNRVRINASGWQHLAKVVVRMAGSSRDSEDGLANARLIAAAPDLLETLKMALGNMGDWNQDGPTIQAIKATIAKAEGSQP